MAIIRLYEEKKWILDWILIVFWTFSSAILLFSLYQEYIEKVTPCKLCKWQRSIYFLVFCLSPFGLMARYNQLIKKGLTLLFFLGLLLGAYHMAIQLDWLPDRCAITQKIEKVEDFMQMLEQPKIACKPIHWKLFGLSAAIYNVIFSLIALLILANQNKFLQKKGSLREPFS